MVLDCVLLNTKRTYPLDWLCSLTRRLWHCCEPPCRRGLKSQSFVVGSMVEKKQHTGKERFFPNQMSS